MASEMRLLTETDANQYSVLRAACLESNPLSWLSRKEDEAATPPFYTANRLRSAIMAPVFGIYGLFEDGKLVGYAQLASGYWFKKRHIVNFYDVCVDPNFRQKGHGKKLLQFLIGKARSLPEAEKVELKVNSKNTGAIAFYEKLGFKKVATLPDSVKEADGSYQAEYIYNYNLQNFTTSYK